MSYSKVVSDSQKKGWKKIDSQTHKKGDTSNLTDYVKSFRRDQIPKKPEIKILRPAGSRPLQGTCSKAIGSELMRQLSDLKIKEETDEEKKETLKRYLEKNRVETPFIWKPTQTKPIGELDVALSRLQEKDEEIRDEHKFKWRNFILQLVISYELFRAGKLTQAVDKVRELEATLVELSRSCGEYLFLGIKEALWHVVIASKTFLYIEKNLVNEAAKLMEEIQKVDTMKRAAQAGIHGIRAAVFMEYGHQGNKNALEEAKKAEKLDPSCAEWTFLSGKCMGRIRRVSQCHEEVDKAEIYCLSKAKNTDPKNPLYVVYLAQALLEQALRNYKQNYPKPNTEAFKKIANKYLAAKYKFIEAREMRPDCPHMLTRCARGMMKLPRNMVDLKFVFECSDRAVELAPNNAMAHHVKGMVCERFGVDADAALNAFKEAANLGNFGAMMDLVRMHHLLKYSNIVEKLESAATTFEEPYKRQVAYTQAGSYLLFIQKDLVDAVKQFSKVVDMDSDSYAMKSHKPLFFRMKDPVNMFKVLLEELDNRTDLHSFGQDSKALKHFRIKIRKHDSSPEKKRLSVQEILEMSKSQLQKDEENRNKRYEHHKVRGEKRHIEGRGKKRWRGKGKNPEGKRKDTNSKNKKGSSNNSANDFSTHSSGRRGCGRKRGSLSRNERANSASSVDSDYQRDSVKHGPRGFFFKSTCEQKDPFSRDVRDSRLYDLSSDRIGWQRNIYSRDPSVSSMHSNESREDKAIDQVENSRGVHISRRLSYQTGAGENKIKLTVENLKKFDGANAQNIETRRQSMMSISSAGSGYESGEEKLSVMDRVKASYRMLSYKSNSVQNSEKKKPFRKSGSSQSLNTVSNFQEGFGEKTNLERRESTQSLNVQQTTSQRSRYLDGYKPAFGSRDSSVQSSRSLTFMPTFAQKSSESDFE